MRVFVAGASGYIGRHACQELVHRGHEVVAFVRPSFEGELPGVLIRRGEVTDPQSLAKEGLRGEGFDAVVSCLATRTGGVKDAWAIEYQAQLDVLASAQASGVKQFVLLSAICVQRPRLAFQKAKLAFEAALVASGLTYSIVRPTAFFKSLAGQVERVQSGKPFMVLGSGELTRCKPISERDLARYLADCLEDPGRQNAILPIGGPGPAVSGLDQAEMMGRALDRRVEVRRIPLALMKGIVGVLNLASKLFPSLEDKAEFARIGRYYATESMLVWSDEQGGYSDDLTPEYGRDTLQAFYDRVVREGLKGQELGEHSVF
ncbi:MAG: NAD(P)H-binding protein [Myxococcota bacterium]